jgi:hypothetical protein
VRVEQTDLDKDPSGVEVRPGDSCFYCGEPLPSPPYVIWAGTTGQIGLHDECAEKLADHLHTDAQPRH